MICEQCHERPATVIVKQSQNGQLSESHLCHICAAENHHILNIFEQDPLGINQLLSNWFPAKPTAVNPVRQDIAVCEKCGFSFNKFLNIGKFGCGECYDTFAPQLGEIFRRLHNGHAEHGGKVPDSFGHTLKVQREIEELRKQLKASIDEERFEEAAKLRDRIRQLTTELGGEADGN